MAVHDHFDRYYAEKLWAMLPEHYREQDGLAEPQGVLRGFIEVLAQQAATLRRRNSAWQTRAPRPSRHMPGWKRIRPLMAGADSIPRITYWQASTT